jgi:flagellar biosynthesis/type III secretory pathway chaperone
MQTQNNTIQDMLTQIKTAIQQLQQEIQAIDTEIANHQTQIARLKEKRAELLQLLAEIGLAKRDEANTANTAKDTEVLQYLRENGPQRLKELAVKLNVSYRSLNWSIWRLMKTGKVVNIGRGIYKAIE